MNTTIDGIPVREVQTVFPYRRSPLHIDSVGNGQPLLNRALPGFCLPALRDIAKCIQSLLANLPSRYSTGRPQRSWRQSFPVEGLAIPAPLQSLRGLRHSYLRSREGSQIFAVLADIRLGSDHPPHRLA